MLIPRNERTWGVDGTMHRPFVLLDICTFSPIRDSESTSERYAKSDKPIQPRQYKFLIVIN